MSRLTLLTLLLLAPTLRAAEPPALPGAAPLPTTFAWRAGPPLIAPAPRPANPYHAIKDPTIVFHQDRWHLYATIKTKTLTNMEALSFPDWKTADAAPRHVIALVDAYHCAPQILYFTPHQKWYLIYQWADKTQTPAAFGPGFSTLDDPAKPQTLTKPAFFYPKKPATLDKGWLDFWVIGDPRKQTMHLFFTSLDGRMWRAQTTYTAFPHGWTDPQVVLRGDIFEASHTYRLKGQDKFLTIIEAQASNQRRYMKAYLADSLDGKWPPLADTLQKPFAAQTNVTFTKDVTPWTDSISHGELLRDGVDETMTVDPAHLRLLFQGCDAPNRAGKGYGQFPWRLGLLELTNSQ